MKNMLPLTCRILAVIITLVLANLAHSIELRWLTIADAAVSPAQYIDVGETGRSLGDKYMFDQPLRNANGDIIGTNAGQCTRIKLQASLQCQWTLRVPQGAITVAGEEFEKGESILDIINGEGIYSGISGSMRSFKNRNGSFTQILDFTLPFPPLDIASWK